MSVFTKSASIGMGSILGATAAGLYHNDKFDHQSYADSFSDLGEGALYGGGIMAAAIFAKAGLNIAKGMKLPISTDGLAVQQIEMARQLNRMGNFGL